MKDDEMLLSTQFKHLFTPVDVGPVRLRNRISVTPHATMFTSDERNNLPGDLIATYCAERAKGGAALVEISMAIVSVEVGQTAPDTEAHFSPLSGGHPMILTGRWPLRATDPRIVDGYSKLASKVHEHGAKCFIELASGGTNVGNDKGVSRFPWPSRPIHVLPFTPQEMNEEDIAAQIDAYGRGAKLVKSSGLDGVDLHGTHGALISEFLSPLMNKRTDRWGGSLQSRMRFLEEVIKRVRESIGSDIALGMRLIAYERFEGGHTPKDGAEIAKRLDGKLDWITADQGYSPQQEAWQAVPMYVESGYNLGITDPIKSALQQTKVCLVGKYVDATYAESLLASGRADFVAMTRALIADPELPNKAMSGRLEDIRPCIGVLQDCWGRMIRGLPISCTVNPAVSREKEWGIGTMKEASSKKRILVIGGGVAGLEFARLASSRGHKVVIYEKSTTSGGLALTAAKLPGRENIRAIVQWLSSEVKKTGVEIKYGLEVTSDPEVVSFVMDEEKPDAVVIATGSLPIRTGFQPYTMNDVKGWDQEIVCTDQDILEGKVKPGNRAIIADTLGFIEAPGVAEYISKRGAEVEVVTPLENIGLELDLYNHLEHVLPRVFAAHVKVSPYTWVRSVEGRHVTLYNIYYENEPRTEEVDNLVLITGRLQNDDLYKTFQGRASEVHVIGDARIGGARIGNAMYDANELGRKI
jgi:2,4-dienoyl-CoA reductase-like NADH-dependent reductase (Old Yellow Enzyme family)/thioredoxin reductase